MTFEKGLHKKKSCLKMALLISLVMNFVLMGPLFFLTPRFLSSLLLPDTPLTLTNYGGANTKQRKSNHNNNNINPLKNAHYYTRNILEPPEETSSDYDDIHRYGKSCLFNDDQKQWFCQECSPINSTTAQCRTLPRERYNCNEVQPTMVRDSYDVPPRVFSSLDPTSSEDVQMRTLVRIQNRGHSYTKQPLCQYSNSNCFHPSKCFQKNRTLFTIYTNVTNASSSMEYLLDYASTVVLSTQQIQIQRVYDPQEACLSIVFPQTYSHPHDMYTSKHWYPNGQNNLLWDLGNFQMNEWNNDNVYPTFHYEYAMIASSGLNRPTVREGYDLVLPLIRKWKRTIPSKELDIHRPRKYLLSFRGDIQTDKIIPYYNHRWLASEYWTNVTTTRNNNNIVVIDVQCRYQKKITKGYDSYTTYEDIMYNSTFGFCPGGSGVSSYRLGEYMSTGTIPVVVGNDIVGPLEPETNFNKCWIQVSESRIVDIPRIVSELSPEEIQQRQAYCFQLHELVWGNRYVSEGKGNRGYVDDPRVTFTRAMEIVALRIKTAMDYKEQIQNQFFVKRKRIET